MEMYCECEEESENYVYINRSISESARIMILERIREIQEERARQEEIERTLQKVRNLGVESLLPYSALLFLGCRVMCILVRKSPFQDSEETIHSAEINATSYESYGDFHREKTNTKCHFPAPPINNIFLKNFRDWSWWQPYLPQPYRLSHINALCINLPYSCKARTNPRNFLERILRIGRAGK